MAAFNNAQPTWDPGRESLESPNRIYNRQKPPPPTAFTSPVTALQPLWDCPDGPPSPSSKALDLGVQGGRPLLSAGVQGSRTQSAFGSR